MGNFEPGIRIVVIDDNHVRSGVIVNTYDIEKIAVVRFADGTVEKVRFENLGVIQDENVQDEKTTAPVEKSEITITPEEFKKIASEVIYENIKKIDKNAGLLSMALGFFVVELHRALFVGE